jgi:methylthioribulose-1-phosphate dehydratase
MSEAAEASVPVLAGQLAAVGQRCYARGWALGTSGNFSAVISRCPFRLAISASGREKRCLHADDILTVDAFGAPVGTHRAVPSAETLLHVTIAQVRRASAILHTHSVWGTILSDVHAHGRGLNVSGYEMLKGLRGVTSHQHSEWIPILENDQDMPRLAQRVSDLLQAHEGVHGLLLRRHGLYTWGDTLEEAERHVEILEFLFETLCRSVVCGTTAGAEV